MIIGNPDEFAVLIDYVDDWNSETSFWKEGIFDFIFHGRYLSEKIISYTLNEFLIDNQPIFLPEKIIENKSLFFEQKDIAFKFMLDAYNPYILNKDLDKDDEGNRQYCDGYVLNKHYMSGIWVTAVSYQDNIRIMGAITDDLMHFDDGRASQWIGRKEILIHEAMITCHEYQLINDNIGIFLKEVLNSQ